MPIELINHDIRITGKDALAYAQFLYGDQLPKTFKIENIPADENNPEQFIQISIEELPPAKEPDCPICHKKIEYWTASALAPDGNLLHFACSNKIKDIVSDVTRGK